MEKIGVFKIDKEAIIRDLRKDRKRFFTEEELIDFFNYTYGVDWGNGDTDLTGTEY